MKFAYTMLFILVTLIIVSGCSNGEPEKTNNKISIRKPIKQLVKEQSKKAEPDTRETFQESQAQEETSSTNEQEKNIYLIQEGDTLSSIARKPHIYNNSLKWPILYGDNRRILSKIKRKADLFGSGLPAGIKLIIKTPGEVSENLDNRASHYFVINVISSPHVERLAPMVVSLTDNGHFTYLTSTKVNGKEWYRLRTGFYETRAEANRAGNKIKDILNIQDIWAAKIDDNEFLDFGGY